MALLNKNAQTETVAAAATETVVEQQPQEATATQAPTAETKEVAVKQEAGAVTSPTTGIWFTNPMVQQVVDSANYGDFVSITASQGSFQESGSGGRELGKWIAFRPIQAKIKMVCSPNSQDEESKQYFAAVYEGEVTMDGRTIEECVQDAKAAGYDKADVKKYIDLFAYVVGHDVGDNCLVDEVVMLQLSPMSVISWSKFAKKLEMRAAYGNLEVPAAGFVVKAKATADKNKAGKQYTKYEFEAAE